MSNPINHHRMPPHPTAERGAPTRASHDPQATAPDGATAPASGSSPAPAPDAESARARDFLTPLSPGILPEGEPEPTGQPSPTASGTSGTAAQPSGSSSGSAPGNASWQAPTPAWDSPGFGAREALPGQDPETNTYRPGGPLEKYDQAFGAQSQEYEKAKYSFAANDDSVQAQFTGHCDDAATATQLLPEPRYPVTHNGQTFTPGDVKALLAEVAPSLPVSTEYVGQRYDGPQEDMIDLTPEAFDSTIRKWGQESPFAVESNAGEQVWNKVVDTGSITATSTPPTNVDLSEVPSDGNVQFYTAKLSNSGDPANDLTYQYWMQSGAAGDVAASGWLVPDGTPKEQALPDFLWRATPQEGTNLLDPGSWPQQAVPDSPQVHSNPHLSPAKVAEIYLKSIDPAGAAA